MTQHTFASALMAVLMTLTTLTTLTNGHMIMTQPVPFSKDTLDNGPLKNAKPGTPGSDYPCKLRNNPYQISTMNNMVAGEEQTIDFLGSASHMGGACQLAITLDKEPTASSVFKIIQVFEGGCPLHSFKYTVPKQFPNGRATFAWTWYNVVGNREIYMNCAPITVSGGSDNLDFFNSLPNQYVINLPTSECSSVEGTIQRIPVPGSAVQSELGNYKLADATGPSCAASAAAQTQGVSVKQVTSGSGGGDSVGSSSGVAATAAPTSTQAPPPAPPPPPASSRATASSTASIKTSPPPSGMTTVASPVDSATGVKLPIISTILATSGSSSTSSVTPDSPAGDNPAALAISTSTTSSIKSAPTGNSSTGNTSNGSPSSGNNSNGNTASGGSSNTLPPIGTGSSGGVATAGQCSTNGVVVCNGPTQYGLCNFGSVVWQPVAAGTKCENGAIMRRAIPRSVHVRRRFFGGFNRIL